MSPRSAALFSLLPVSALVLAGCSAEDADGAGTEAAAETVTVEALNGDIEVATNPETVVVFDNTQLDILDALGVEVAGIPSAETYPSFFSDYVEDPDVENVGSLFEPDFEAVAGMDPDLIIAGGRSSEAIPELEEIAPTLDMTVFAGDTVGDMKDRALAYGEVFDKQTEAEELVAEFDSRIAEVGEQVADSGDGLVIITSAGEISAYGPGSRYGFFYDALGLTPAIDVTSEEASHGEVLSFEALADADPDWLYVIDRDGAIGEEGAAPAEQVLDNDLVDRTTAAQEDQIIHLNSEEIYLVGGIQAHLNTLDVIEDALS
ncbi:iron ABC transporter substrate-binding protein [Nocardiopsis terrae]|uniref:Iron complex transport system substrate-binding protein n=1 Tax=Nocardiopsis terrae TaxID=372655 RepID=A0ABR9HNF5_9ACTN|nr:ABC transporter substrate-binding protein [Nocardiopsis terrae]MBE1460523.1 iron complex transport system substrate-binding protein [Nocardiopsis terrae]GHC71884.1 iron ABC transporter substrate-binding protein [Nocardiopsis terrae]